MILTILLSLTLNSDTCKTPISGAKLVPRTSEHKNYIVKGKLFFTGTGWSEKKDRTLFLTDSCMLKRAYILHTQWINRQQN